MPEAGVQLVAASNQEYHQADFGQYPAVQQCTEFLLPDFYIIIIHPTKLADQQDDRFSTRIAGVRCYLSALLRFGGHY
jgi:hypothetical protein